MDNKKLENGIKKLEVKIDQEKKKKEKLLQQIEQVDKEIKKLDGELKPMLALKKKQEDFEAAYNSQVASLVDQPIKEEKETKPADSVDYTTTDSWL